jgi:hypothetical protein
VSRGVADGSLSSNANCSRLRSMRLYGMSFGRPMLLNAAHCLPSPVSATGARRRTSALCRRYMNSTSSLPRPSHRHLP